MTPIDNLRRIVAGWRGEWRVDAHEGITLSHDGEEWPIGALDGDATIVLVELLNAIRPAVDGATAEIERLTAELAAARAVPPDVEAAIKSTVDGAEEAGRCAALGHAYLITKAPFWTVPRLKAAIARAISDATASKPATVGGLLATAPVGSIVEWLDGDGDWNQAVACVDDRIPCAMHRWRMAGRWCQYGGFDDAGRHLRLTARLVPAHLADADPASRGEIAPIAPRCSCTREAGDSRCDAHPSCSECGDQTARNVDDCADHCQACASLRRGDAVSITSAAAMCSACKARGPIGEVPDVR